jgi:hypothetical protein
MVLSLVASKPNAKPNPTSHSMIGIASASVQYQSPISNLTEENERESDSKRLDGVGILISPQKGLPISF